MNHASKHWKKEESGCKYLQIKKVCRLHVPKLWYPAEECRNKNTMKQTAHSQTHMVSVHSVSHPYSTADSYVNMWVHSVHGRPLSWHPEAEHCLTWGSPLSLFFFNFHLTASITGCGDGVKFMGIMFLEKLQRFLVLLSSWHDATNPLYSGCFLSFLGVKQHCGGFLIIYLSVFLDI